MIQNSSLLQRRSVFSTTDNTEDWDFFSTWYVSMTLTIYICDFFLFKLSDSRQSLCRPDGCINITMKILLKYFGMRVLLAKCWKSHRIANKQIPFIFSLNLTVKLHRKKNPENHLKTLLCKSWLVHTKVELEVN